MPKIPTKKHELPGDGHLRLKTDVQILEITAGSWEFEDFFLEINGLGADVQSSEFTDDDAPQFNPDPPRICKLCGLMLLLVQTPDGPGAYCKDCASVDATLLEPCPFHDCSFDKLKTLPYCWQHGELRSPVAQEEAPATSSLKTCGNCRALFHPGIDHNWHLCCDCTPDDEKASRYLWPPEIMIDGQEFIVLDTTEGQEEEAKDALTCELCKHVARDPADLARHYEANHPSWY